MRTLHSLYQFASLALLLAACGGGGGGGGGGGNPPPDTGAVPSSIGLVSAAAGDGAVRLVWDATDGEGASVAVALFRSTNENTLFSGAPITTSTGGGAHTASSLTNGVDQFFGLAVDLGASNYDPVGAVFRFRPNAPIHVDAASMAPAPDGLSPATAFPTVAQGVAEAVLAGGGNVWIAAGSYAATGLAFGSGVDLSGGFTSAFTLVARDPEAHPTVLQGGAGIAMLALEGGGAGVALDGLVVDAQDVTSFGIDVDSTDARISACEVRNSASHGIRMRSTSASGAIEVDVVGSRVRDSNGEGLSLEGTFELGLFGSRFASNRLEGVQLGPLLAPNGVAASLYVQDCVFAQNGEDGLDCQLAPPTVIAGSSSYRVRVERSIFERNGFTSPTGGAGLRVDIDFETAANWSADILIRGCTSRANDGNGFDLDLDASTMTFLHRLRSTANVGDGLHVSSETRAGIAVVTHSAFIGNLGAGARATFGNVPLQAAHCIFAGNAGGGFASTDVTSTAAACVASLQPTPFTGVQQAFCVTVADALTPLFVNAPVEYARVSSSNATYVTLTAAGDFVVNDPVEVADDGVARTVASFGAATQLTLAAHPTDVDSPSTLARFAVGSGVIEDVTLAPGSAALAAGLPAPTGPTQDAGVFGGDLAGEPGLEPASLPDLFRPSSTSPAPTTALASNTTILVSFTGGTLAAGSVAGQVRARNSSGTLLAIGAAAAGAQLSITPPGGGWPTGPIVIEFHAGIASTAGVALPCPIAMTFQGP